MSGTQTKLKENPAQKDALKLEGLQKIVNRVILAIWCVMTIFLLLRAILEGVGSHATSLFATVVFLVSDVFLFPFFGIFSGSANALPTGVPSFDGVAFLAILCYSILLFLVFIVAFLVIRILKTEKQVDAALKNNKPIDPGLSQKVLT